MKLRLVKPTLRQACIDAVSHLGGLGWSSQSFVGSNRDPGGWGSMKKRWLQIGGDHSCKKYGKSTAWNSDVTAGPPDSELEEGCTWAPEELIKRLRVISAHVNGWKWQEGMCNLRGSPRRERHILGGWVHSSPFLGALPTSPVFSGASSYHYKPQFFCDFHCLNASS